MLLPGDQGILFANGYMLATGEVKTYETGLSGLRFERRVAAGNGEDTLFVFYQRASGHYVLFSYNVIAQIGRDAHRLHRLRARSGRPDGACSRRRSKPQKHHALQVWRTPYVAESGTAVPAEKRESLLFKIGNSALVRGMAEAREMLILLGKGDTYADVYLELVRRSREVLDGYFWLKEKEAASRSPSRCEAIHAAANAAIDEFDKVGAPAPGDRRADREVRAATEKLLKAVRDQRRPTTSAGFVQHLADLRLRRGEIIGLRELRYADNALIDDLDKRVAAAADAVSGKTVEFLLREESLDPYRRSIETQRASLAEDRQDRRGRRDRQGARPGGGRAGDADRHRQQPPDRGRHADHRDHREHLRALRHAQRHPRPS